MKYKFIERAGLLVFLVGMFNTAASGSRLPVIAALGMALTGVVVYMAAGWLADEQSGDNPATTVVVDMGKMDSSKVQSTVTEVMNALAKSRK